MPTPSLLTFAKLSQHAYRIDKGIEVPEGWVLLATKALPIGSITKKISIRKVEKVSGLFHRAGAAALDEREETTITEEVSTRLAAYYNPLDNQIVVAFRGTEFTEPADLAADLEIIVKVEPSRVREALSFVNEIRGTSKTWAFWHTHRLFSRCQWTAPEIFLTGHSLGAAIAERLTLDTGYPSVIFDSPGCDDRESTRRYRYADRITSVLSFPNLINCANRHLGKVLHVPARVLGAERKITLIDTARPWVESGVSILLAYYGIRVPTVVGEAYGAASAKASHLLHTAQTHSIDGFVEYLQGDNPISEVSSWPSITTFIGSKDPMEVKPGLVMTAAASASLN